VPTINVPMVDEADESTNDLSTESFIRWNFEHLALALQKMGVILLREACSPVFG